MLEQAGWAMQQNHQVEQRKGFPQFFAICEVYYPEHVYNVERLKQPTEINKGIRTLL